jgi:iron(III) transport system substrate-binding protein
VPTARVQNAALESLGKFKADTLPLATLGKYLAEAQRLADRAGYK